MAKKKARTKKPAGKTPKKAVKKTARRAKPIPDGYHVVTAGFRVPRCGGAIAFLEKAFGAKVRNRYDGPGGIVYHAEIRIGDSVIMCGEPQAGLAEPLPVMAMLYVKDSDSTYARAIGLGAKAIRPIEDQFYGDRSGTVRDAWGNEWTISTHKEDVPPREIKRRMSAMTKNG